MTTLGWFRTLRTYHALEIEDEDEDDKCLALTLDAALSFDGL